MFSFEPFTTARRYVGKLQTLRNEVRTRRVISRLPRSIQKDIGWPDAFFADRNRRQ
jgi:hypothetical protein